MIQNRSAPFSKPLAFALILLATATTPLVHADHNVVSDGGKTEPVALESEPGLEAFAETYLAARNARDSGKVKAMYHPADLAALAKFVQIQPAAPGQAKPTLEAVLLQNPVPATHPPFIVQRYLKDSPLPQAGFMEWPIPPTHLLQFSYSTGPNNGGIFVLRVAQVDHRWYVVGGAPSAEFIKKMTPPK